MSHLGLIMKFRENHAFTIWLELAMALPLLPKDDIITAWEELKSMQVPDMPRVQFRVSESLVYI